MSLSSHTIAGEVFDADGRVAGDLVCAECGYNLRTLAESADCPECGMRVVVSARRDQLVDAPPDWLNRLRGGSWWLRAGVLLALPTVYPGVAVSCYAVWMLTCAEPGRDEPSLDRGFRVGARVGVIVGAVVMVLLAVGALLAVAMGWQRLFEDWAFRGLPMFDLVFLCGHAVYVLGLLSLWRYLRVLALRVPDEELASCLGGLGRRWMGAVLAIAGVCGLAYGGYWIGVLPGATQSIWLPMGVMAFIAAVLLWLWGVTFRVVGRLVRLLAEVGEAAGQDESGGER